MTDWFKYAEQELDKHFGEGFAEKHPELVVQLTCARMIAAAAGS